MRICQNRTEQNKAKKLLYKLVGVHIWDKANGRIKCTARKHGASNADVSHGVYYQPQWPNLTLWSQECNDSNVFFLSENSKFFFKKFEHPFFSSLCECVVHPIPQNPEFIERRKKQRKQKRGNEVEWNEGNVCFAYFFLFVDVAAVGLSVMSWESERERRDQP